MHKVKELIDELKENNVEIVIGANGKINLLYDDNLQLSVELVSTIKNYRDDIIEYLKFHSHTVHVEIPKVPFDNCYKMSDAQRRLWILSQFEDASIAYNTPKSIKFAGNFHKNYFIQAIEAVIARHEILRTVFQRDQAGEIRQWILNREDLDFKIDYKDFRKEKDKEEKVKNYIGEDSYKAFDLEKGPLLRAALLQVEDEAYVFYYNMHHIISDGWSMEVVSKDVFAYYEAYKEHKEPALAPLRIQYKDYSAWQLAQLEEESFKAHRDYWLNKLAGELPVLDLPGIKQRPGIKTYTGHGLGVYLDPATTARLKNYSHEKGGSLFIGLLAAWNVLMYRYTSQKDIVIGTPVAGRSHSELEDQIGFYLNTLAFRNYVDPEQNFADFYKEVKESTLAGYTHQAYPFNRLVDELDLTRDISRSPVFDILLDFHNTGNGIEKSERNEKEISSISDLGKLLVKYDLELHFRETGDCISLQLNFNEALYERHFIEGMLRHYKRLIGQLLDQSDVSIGRIDFLSEEEKKELIQEFNTTGADYSKNKTVIDLFSEQVKKTPSQIAIRNGVYQLTYKELDELSNQLGHCIIKDYGVRPKDLVGIKLDKGEWAVISMLSVLKAGAAYIPIDPEYPASRKQHILSESKIDVLITDTNYLYDEDAFDGSVFAIDVEFEKDNYSKEPLNQVRSVASLAYVIYTSGSTGKPKGVMISHGSLMNYLTWGLSNYMNGLERLDFGLFTSLSFDLTVTSLFLPLLSGGEIRMFDSALDVSSVLQRYFQSEVACIKLTPAHVGVLKDLKLETTSIRVAILGGDKLENTHVEILKRLNPRMRVYNEYGPTESTVGCMVREIMSPGEDILIGRPIFNTQIYLLSEEEQLQAKGVIGEICIGGEGLAEGYLNREELTREKFVKNPFKETGRLYKTGDLGRWTKDGSMEFIGRKDDQVKIRGYRIELGEIEHALLKKDGLEEAVVLAKANENNEKELVAYIVASTEQNASELRAYLKESLPEYMLPAHFIQMDTLPLTSNGKIDRKALLDSQGSGLAGGVEYVAPRNEIEEKLVRIWQDVLRKEKEDIGIDEGFFSAGGNSIKLLGLKSKIDQEFKVNCSVASLFQYGTIRQQADMLLKENSDEHTHGAEQEKPTSVFRGETGGESSTDIAVIGMSIRAPGSRNIQEFWQNLRNGKESIIHFSEEELLSFISENELSNKDYVRANSYLEDKECFDSNFFGYLPDEAKLMDPQTRIFHEVVWSALEDSGYDPLSYKGLIGLYAGAGSNLEWGIYSQIANEGRIDGFTASNLSNRDFANTLTAYKLSLKGPVNSINTACSTSLVAIHHAVKSLLSGENHIAIAGGVSITNKQKEEGYLYQEGMILSKDGHNRTFDSASSGTVGGEGAGAVVLKKLSAAIEDGDQIYAIIKGSAINNDGDRKVGFTAPSVDGQTEVIRLAHKAANVKAESISYVEAHGTATKLGDPIEVLALTQAFGKSVDKYCALGSVKTNVGHLDTAAGVAGFIKTVLCLKNKELVPSLHFKSPNSEINFKESPFYVNTELKEWPAEDFPRRAGVSSFGIGGTNAHVILEEPPALPAKITEQSFQLISLSAKTSGALGRAQENLKGFLRENRSADLADVAWTLQNRRPFLYRSSFVAQTIDQAIEYLEKAGETKSRNGGVQTRAKKIAFMFSGQGSQYANMGRALYEVEGSVFRKTLDGCFEIAENLTHIDFKKILYPGDQDEKNPINETINTQPILFMFEYSLARQMEYYGIRSDMMIGHSIGEYVAACLGGVLTLEGALKMVIKRAELMQELPKGTMLAVGVSANKIKEYLPKEVDLAAVNTPESCVISGDTESISHLSNRFEKEGIPSRVLHTSHAFHSAMMDPILEKFTQAIDSIEINSPAIPYISNLTGQKITEKELKQKEYWSSHIRETVKFSAGIEEIVARENVILIEVGPGNTLSAFARQHFNEKQLCEVHQLVRHPNARENDVEFLLSKISDLWQSGLEIDWSHLQSEKVRHKISLPAYPFEKIKYPTGKNAVRLISDKLSRLSEERRLDESEWYYVPCWKSCKLAHQLNTNEEDDWFLVFCDEGGIGQDLIRLPEMSTKKTVMVKSGSDYRKTGEHEFELNPYNYEGYAKLFNALRIKEIHPKHIVHLLSLDQSSQGQMDEEDKERSKVFGFYSVLHLAKELSKMESQLPVNLSVVTNNLQDVFDEEVIHPSKSLISGIIMVISQENPLIQTRLIDLSLENNREKGLRALVKEVKSEIRERYIAYRNNTRWIRDYTSLTMPSSKTGNESKIKQSGTYLITGGLGGVGFIYAKHLLETYKANLILIGRSEISTASTETASSAGGTINKKDQEKKNRLELLQKTGNVSYHAVNISDLVSMQKIVDKAEEKFGKINGVIHTAVAAEGISYKGIDFLSVEDCEKQFEAKIAGALVIEEVFKNRQLDFCLLTSSLASIIGGKEFASYASANAYLDYFSRKGVLKNTVSVNFDGLNFNEELRSEAMLNPQEVIKVFETVLLTKDNSQILVSLTELEHRIKKWVYAKPDLTGEIQRDVNQSIPVVLERSGLSTFYSEPQTQTEKELSQMFQSFFGGGEIGIDDDFFELGGDSLKAMTLISRIHKKLNIQLRIKDILECPNIRRLGQEIDSLKNIGQMRKDGTEMQFEHEIEI